MPNVMITQRGMDFVTSAHDLGVFIYLKWFVPVYDDRIDNNVRTSGYTLSSFADIANVSATTPYGEIIWNRPGYTVNYSSKYLISAVPLVGSELQNSYQKSTTYTNLYKGNPLSDQVSASYWGSSAVGTTGYYNWNAPDGAVGVSADNPDGEKWVAEDYYPVYESSEENHLRGSIKCKIDKNKGNFKFNKIALYAQQNGTSETCFFGEAYLEVPAAVSKIEVGFEHFEFDIQIDISGAGTSWENIFFSSSADYWSHSPGGLYYPNKIGVGQFDDNAKEINATMHLRTARDTSGNIDDSVPQLRIDSDNNNFFHLTRTKRTGEIGGDILLTSKNYCTNKYKDTTLIPMISGGKSFNFGNSTYAFGDIYGADGTIAILKDQNKYSMVIKDRGISFTDLGDSLGRIDGADISRNENLLFVYTYYCAALNHGKNIGIVAGFSGDSHDDLVDRFNGINIPRS